MSNKLPTTDILGMQIGNNPDRAQVELLSMAVGGNGFSWITSSAAASGHEYYAFHAITETVISAITFPSSYAGDSDIVGVTIPANTTLFFNFTAMTLTSGTGVGYFV
jgi:hypothetical protein